MWINIQDYTLRNTRYECFCQILTVSSCSKCLVEELQSMGTYMRLVEKLDKRQYGLSQEVMRYLNHIRVTIWQKFYRVFYKLKHDWNTYLLESQVMNVCNFMKKVHLTPKEITSIISNLNSNKTFKKEIICTKLNKNSRKWMLLKGDLLKKNGRWQIINKYKKRPKV